MRQRRTPTRFSRGGGARCSPVRLSLLALMVFSAGALAQEDANKEPAPPPPAPPRAGLKLEDADLQTVLELYAKLSGKTVLPVGKQPEEAPKFTVIAAEAHDADTGKKVLADALTSRGYYVDEQEERVFVYAPKASPVVVKVYELKYIHAYGQLAKIAFAQEDDRGANYGSEEDDDGAKDGSSEVTASRPLQSLADMIKAVAISAMPAGAGGDEARGIVQLAGNKLIVRAPLSVQGQIESLIAPVDQRPAQILIEAKFVEVSRSTDAEIGLDWTYADNSGATQWRAGGDTFNTTGMPIAGPQTAGTLGLNFIFSRVSRGGSGLLLDLKARSQDIHAKVLSSPRILAKDGVKAIIHSTESIPYLVSDYSDSDDNRETQTYAREDVGITLVVLPKVMADDTIALHVDFEFDTQKKDDTVKHLHRFEARNASSDIVVKSGQTIIIGGLMADKLVKTVTGVPFLKNIPYLGGLFRHTSHKPMTSELVMLLRPMLLRSDADARDATSQQQESLPKTLELSGEEFRF